jgi:heme oxygenase
MNIDCYLARSEFDCVSDKNKLVIKRYVRRFAGDLPVGRILAMICIKMNNHNQIFNQNFINWLYYY